MSVEVDAAGARGAGCADLVPAEIAKIGFGEGEIESGGFVGEENAVVFLDYRTENKNIGRCGQEEVKFFNCFL